MKLYIKNMVSRRCKMVVKSELDKLKLNYSRVELGETEIIEDISPEQMDCLRVALNAAGLELMEDKKILLAEKIKTTIIELIHNTNHQNKISFSDYLSEKLNHNYKFLSILFSETKGTTIEKFYLSEKIEKVKELLVYDELNLTEIAYKLNYSSIAHLSNQFKKITGLTTSGFKNLIRKRQFALVAV